MGYPLRIESKNHAAFTTTRCKNSELWFINNEPLEIFILTLIARYAELNGVILYAIAIEGSHIHILADYPRGNCAAFKRCLNSMIGRFLPRYCLNIHKYKVLERRYSKELVSHHPEDLEDRFFYTVLQPVQDGLVPKISEYPGYNCFTDAVRGIKREFKYVDWTRYNRAKRSKKTVNIKDYTKTHTLEFSKLPGFKDLSDKEYAKVLSERLEERRQKIVQKRQEEGKGFVGREKLLQTKPGTRAKNPKTSPKTSTAWKPRPRVLSVCPERRLAAKKFYFSMCDSFLLASARYRKGFINTKFPEGMYRPHLTTNITDPPPINH